MTAALLLPTLWAAGAASAEAEKDAEAEIQQQYFVKSRQRQVVGRKCSRVLEQVQALTEAEQWAQARPVLEGALGSCSSNFEKSQVYNFLGYVYYALERYDDAITTYRKMINAPGVDERQAVNTRYTIAQLYLVQEDYANAAKELEAWMRVSPIVGADAKVLLGQAYYQLDRKRDALRLIDEAVSEQEAKGNLPKEGWWSLQGVIYYELHDYQRVVDILKKLITHYPGFSYWRQLGGIYAELDQEINQLVALELAYLAGDLNEEDQVISLAYLYIGAEAPFRAAQILEQAMIEGKVSRNGDNLEVLGLAWEEAQEAQKAVSVLEEAAQVSPKGAIYSRLAGVYLELDENDKAVVAARNAIRAGDVSRIDTTYMNLGNALVNLHCYAEAVQAFNNAAKDDRSAQYARQWIEYAEREGARRSKLLASGARIDSCKPL